ncbi:WYL domain-containing protein [Bacillus sp. NPDC077411]|uniref:TnsA endonuclease N-terminal domain-containing protein n=1 Tax=Bacillus sp. NPDC077411 TaxID=3363947 RepID=UPI0037C547BB
MEQKLVRALKSKSQIQIKYNDTERTIDPLYLLKYTNFLYVAGYCHYREEHRIFRLSRIQSCEVLGEEIQTSIVPFEQINIGVWSRSKVTVLQTVGGEILPPSKSSSVRQDPYDNPKPKMEYPKKVHFNKMEREGTCRSPMEEIVFTELDNDPSVGSFEVEPFKIPYVFKGRSSHYVPDVLVLYKNGRKELIEIKLSGDISFPKNQAKFMAGRDYAEKNNMHFVVRGIHGTSGPFHKIDELDWELAKDYKKSHTFPITPPMNNTSIRRNYQKTQTKTAITTLAEKKESGWGWIMWVIVALWILSSFVK